MANSHFDEKSGIVAHNVQDWGRWYQTVAEVVVEIDLQPGTRGKDVNIVLKPNHISCTVLGKLMFEGIPFSTIDEEESIWTIEDRKLLRFQLIKANRKTKDECWLSLLRGQFQPDPLVLNEMRKKLDLEIFQLENPGFDFSGAKLDKRYEDMGVKKVASHQN